MFASCSSEMLKINDLIRGHLRSNRCTPHFPLFTRIARPLVIGVIYISYGFLCVCVQRIFVVCAVRRGPQTNPCTTLVSALAVSNLSTRNGKCVWLLSCQYCDLPFFLIRNNACLLTDNIAVYTLLHLPSLTADTPI